MRSLPDVCVDVNDASDLITWPYAAAKQNIKLTLWLRICIYYVVDIVLMAMMLDICEDPVP